MLTQEMNVPILEPDAKKDRLKILVDYFTINRNNHTFYAFKFFLCELLNFINVVGQIYFMDFFLDGEFTTYGKYYLCSDGSDTRNHYICTIFTILLTL